MTEAEIFAQCDRIPTVLGGARLVFEALRAEHVRVDVAWTSARIVPFYLNAEWRGLDAEMVDARSRAVRFDEDRRHAKRPLYWRCAMPACRHCGSNNAGETS